MDDVFWSNVVKRWSEASENVIKLKKELAKVQEERALYRDIVESLRKPEIRTPPHPRLFGHVRDESTRTIVVDEDQSTSTLKDELQDAEIGLGRAKEEYRRLQKELAESTEKIMALALENQQLRSRQEHGFSNERQQFNDAQKELIDVRLENRDLAEKLRDLEQENSRLRTVHDHPGELTPRPPLFGPVSGVSLERQPNNVQEAVEQDLRLELEFVKEKLFKAEENNKVLTKSIVKLQQITRHSMTSALQTISSNLPSGSPRSSRGVSLASNHSKGSETVENINSKSTATPGGPCHIEDMTVVDSHPSSVESLYGFLPPGREIALSKHATVHIQDIIPNHTFDRDFLKSALGDGLDNLIQRLSEKRGCVEKRPTISPYLCPTLNHHPWCPSTPGQHGFIFVGLGKEKDSYKSPALRNLFVGLTKTQTRSRKFRYLGTYRVSRVKPLDVHEWNTLPEDVKLMYAKLTKDKTKDTRSQEDILVAYDHGDLLVPCVLLQCISFDEALYEVLISQQDSAPRT